MSRRRCCCLCELFHDWFNRDDSTDLGASWTEVSGQWEIKSNKLYETGEYAGTPIVLCDTVMVDNAAVVDVKLIAPVAGNIYGIVMAYDSGSYYLAQVEIRDNAGTREAQLSLWLNTTLLVDSSWLPISDSLYPDELSITSHFGEDWFCLRVNTTIGGACHWIKTWIGEITGTGLKTGLIGCEQEVYYNDFVLEKHHVSLPICRRCVCLCTQDGTEVSLPDELTLTISGDHTCSTASGDIKLRYVGDDCADWYVSDPTTATGCLTGYTFSLVCQLNCASGSCSPTLLMAPPAPCGCFVGGWSGQLSGTCDPVNMVSGMCETTGCPGNCQCCTGPNEDIPWYCRGRYWFTVSE